MHELTDRVDHIIYMVEVYHEEFTSLHLVQLELEPTPMQIFLLTPVHGIILCELMTLQVKYQEYMLTDI
jgi:hypothetical protein